jgi:hypothetical protein
MLTWPTANQSISFLLLNILLAMLDKNLAEIDYKEVQELLVQPRELMIVDKGSKLRIFAFVAKFVSRIYRICTINTWLSKKKGSTFFDLMTMSDIAYTVAVLENIHEVWDPKFNKKKMSRIEWELYMKREDYAIKTKIHIKVARRENIAIRDGVRMELNSKMR